MFTQLYPLLEWLVLDGLIPKGLMLNGFVLHGSGLNGLILDGLLLDGRLVLPLHCGTDSAFLSKDILKTNFLFRKTPTLFAHKRQGYIG